MPSYFKVVTPDLKSFISSINEPSIRQSKYVVQYELNKIVYPIENTKLFVFENFHAARDFQVCNGDDLCIYICHAVNPQICLGVGIHLGCIDYQAIDSFWSKPCYINTKNPPSGTLMCDGVQLLAKVEC